jgi:glycosyltransferase involved in cell wall biosynthesis
MHQRASFQAALDRMVDRSRYDIVQVEGCSMAHFSFPQDAALVLDEHNIEYELLSRIAAVTRSVPRKLWYRLDELKLRVEEQRCWRSVDACAVTSPRDEAVLRRAFPGARSAVVPNAVDLEFFTPRRAEPEPLTVLFFGVLDYYPNTDGVLFFLREVMPRLKQAHPAVRVLVVGPAPTSAIQRWAGPDVTITGAVEDVRPYLERARVVIAPIRSGGGTRLKVLEAMAMGKPVVSTRLGAEGLSVTDDSDILLADDPETFARQVGRLLGSDDLAARVGRAARRLVETSYDWKASARTLEALYRAASDHALRRLSDGQSVTWHRTDPQSAGVTKTEKESARST